MAPQDPITNQVKDRCLAIIAFLLKADCASIEEVYKALNIENPKGLRDDAEALEVMFGDLKKAVVNIVDSIRQNLDDEYQYIKDPEESPDKALIESADALIEEYEIAGEIENIWETINLIDKSKDVGKRDFVTEKDPIKGLIAAANLLIEEYEAIESEDEEAYRK